MPRMETPGSARVAAASSRAWFSASISDFLQTQPDAVVGRLATNSDFTLLLTPEGCLVGTDRVPPSTSCRTIGLVVFGVQHPTYGAAD
jgi:hypothetical protein